MKLSELKGRARLRNIVEEKIIPLTSQRLSQTKAADLITKRTGPKRAHVVLENAYQCVSAKAKTSDSLKYNPHFNSVLSVLKGTKPLPAGSPPFDDARLKTTIGHGILIELIDMTSPQMSPQIYQALLTIRTIHNLAPKICNLITAYTNEERKYCVLTAAQEKDSQGRVTSKEKVPNGLHCFVRTNLGFTFVRPLADGEKIHAYMVRCAEKIRSAGVVEFLNGIMTSWNNCSGSFFPPAHLAFLSGLPRASIHQARPLFFAEPGSTVPVNEISFEKPVTTKGSTPILAPQKNPLSYPTLPPPSAPSPQTTHSAPVSPAPNASLLPAAPRSAHLQAQTIASAAVAPAALASAEEAVPLNSTSSEMDGSNSPISRSSLSVSSSSSGSITPLSATDNESPTAAAGPTTSNSSPTRVRYLTEGGQVNRHTVFSRSPGGDSSMVESLVKGDTSSMMACNP